MIEALKKTLREQTKRRLSNCALRMINSSKIARQMENVGIKIGLMNLVIVYFIFALNGLFN